MKKLNIFIIFAIVLTFVFNYSATETYACSCIQPGSPSEELNNSSTVFSGKVVEIVDKNKNSIIQSSADSLEIRMEVIETWKGVSESEVIVKTVRDSASCGFHFTLNEEYLVYAYESDADGHFHVNLCSRTASLADATADMNDLGTGEIPSKQTQPSGEKPSKQTQPNEDISNGFNFQIEMIILLLLFIFGVIGFFLFRKDTK